MIKCIIQVADIHIRNFLRLEEYATQLEKFVKMCEEIASQYEKDEVRILVCGDIVHSKNQISNELMTFASTFLRQLSTITPVVVYSGNHDLLVNNKSRMDTLTALFETAQFTNITFLDQQLGYKSGCIKDKNVVWALYSIHDNYSKPDIIKESDEETVIGLYHGTIVGAQLNNGFIVDNGKEGDSFEGCDYVMAGDIHKYQVLKRGDVEIIYSGSLIQQTFGETTTQHGFVVWDLEDKVHTFMELPTDYGLYDFEISSIEDIDGDFEKLINY